MYTRFYNILYYKSLQESSLLSLCKICLRLNRYRLVHYWGSTRFFALQNSLLLSLYRILYYRVSTGFFIIESLQDSLILNIYSSLYYWVPARFFTSESLQDYLLLNLYRIIHYWDSTRSLTLQNVCYSVVIGFFTISRLDTLLSSLYRILPCWASTGFLILNRYIIIESLQESCNIGYIQDSTIFFTITLYRSLHYWVSASFCYDWIVTGLCTIEALQNVLLHIILCYWVCKGRFTIESLQDALSLSLCRIL